MNPKANEVLFSLTTEQWKEILLRLQRYAISVSRRLRWRSRNYQHLPNGETPDSVVSMAIEKVLTGERVWNPETHPDLTKYLRDVIDSLLSHLRTSLDNALFVHTDNLDDVSALLAKQKDQERAAAIEAAESNAELLSDSDEIDDKKGYEQFDRENEKQVPSEKKERAKTVPEWLRKAPADPQQIAGENQERMIAARAYSLLLQACSGDPLSMRMLSVMADGITKPGEIAAALTLPVGTVYNASKRLDRKISAVASRIRDEIKVGAIR